MEQLRKAFSRYACVFIAQRFHSFSFFFFSFTKENSTIDLSSRNLSIGDDDQFQILLFPRLSSFEWYIYSYSLFARSFKRKYRVEIGSKGNID